MHATLEYDPLAPWPPRIGQFVPGHENGQPRSGSVKLGIKGIIAGHLHTDQTLELGSQIGQLFGPTNRLGMRRVVQDKGYGVGFRHHSVHSGAHLGRPEGQPVG